MIVSRTAPLGLAVVIGFALLLGVAGFARAQSPGPSEEPGDASANTTGHAPRDGRQAERVVSLNPSLSAIILALGAGESIVGVDDYSARQQTELAELPRVGGLFSPSLEAVSALGPDAVVLVPSAEQRAFRSRLEEIGIEVIAFENIRFEQVIDNIRELGALLGREAAAESRVSAIVDARREVAKSVAGRSRPGTLLILQRDPLYIVGGGSFLDTLLESAGAKNLGANFAEPYPRVGVEWLVGARPDVLIDMTPDATDSANYWARWPSLPAVAQGRVVRLDPKLVALPGPWLDRSLRLLAAAVHPGFEGQRTP